MVTRRGEASVVSEPVEFTDVDAHFADTAFVAAAEAEPETAGKRPISIRFKKYSNEVFNKVQGFVQREHIWLLEKIVRFQEADGIEGDFLEIGVHHGRFFLALEHAARPDDRGVAIDVFEDQHLNIDGSGYGNRAVFETNLETHACDRSRIRVERADSTAIEARKLLAELGLSYRLISVDGGHTAQHAASDLRLAEAYAANGAAVFLDDFFNAGFPGVTEGLVHYLQAGGLLLPVASLSGKLLMTNLSYADKLRSHLQRQMAREPSLRVRETRFMGHDYLAARRK